MVDKKNLENLVNKLLEVRMKHDEFSKRTCEECKTPWMCQGEWEPCGDHFNVIY